jgi:hypothetical protein
MEILLVLLKVGGQFLDFAAKDRDLDIGRAGIAFMAGCILNYGRLYAFRKHWAYLTTS